MAQEQPIQSIKVSLSSGNRQFGGTLRILVFNWRDWEHPGAGGAEMYTHRVIAEWAKMGHSVTLFCSGHPGLPELDVSGDITIVRRGNRYSVYREARLFYQREARGKFDVVIDEINTRPFHCPRFVDDTPIIALIHQVAREIWFHEFPKIVGIAGRVYFEKHWLSEYANVPVVTVSESSRESLLDYGIKHSIVVPEGLSLPDAMPNVEKEVVPTVLFCGRLSSNKRPDHAIRAYQHLRERMPDIRMWVVGTGRKEERLRRMAGEGVTFLGRVSHEKKFELMARSHALLATSVREGWGLVVSEAASVGTHSFGYDVPGLRDSINASRGELVVPNPSALADSLYERLPAIMSGAVGAPTTGGLAPWSFVAEGILAPVVGEIPRLVFD